MPTDLNREGLEAAKVKPLDLANVIRDAFLAGAGMDTASKEAKRIPADILGRLNSYDPEHVPAYHRIVAVIRTHLTRAKPGRMALLVEALDRAHDRMATLDGVDNDDLCAIIDASAALSTVPAKSAAAVGEGWQPIESAPKDGNAVDVWAWNDIYAIGRRFTDCAWVDGRWISAADKTHDYQDQGTVPGSVTHWMPLPARPADGGR